MTARVTVVAKPALRRASAAVGQVFPAGVPVFELGS